jgi:SAM-dependent methyltransferase
MSTENNQHNFTSADWKVLVSYFCNHTIPRENEKPLLASNSKNINEIVAKIGNINVWKGTDNTIDIIEKLFNNLQKPKGKHLDVGSADGSKISPVNDSLQPETITLFDVDIFEMTIPAEIKYDIFHAKPEDDMPFESDSFNTVTLFHVLHHCPKGAVKLLTDIYRVLKPGGYLILKDSNHESEDTLKFHQYVHIVWEKFYGNNTSAGNIEYVTTFENVLEDSENIGFNLVNSYTNYENIAVKPFWLLLQKL